MPYIENEGKLIGEIWFNNVNIEETKEIIHQFWKKRENKVKELQA